MTKHEEIREGLAKDLANFDGRTWGEDSLVDATYRGRAINLMCYLHSQGVASKVKKPFSVTASVNDDGLTAWEPLIKVS